MYKAVILDVDGTLVDSNDAHARAWERALAEHGRRVEFAVIRPLIGMGGDKLLPKAAGIDADSPEGQAIAARRGEIFMRDYLDQLQPTRGAARLLEALADDRLQLVVASSAQKDELQALLRVAGAAKLVQSAASSDDAEHSKPDPDIVHAALRQSGQPADAVVMIGDTPYDVEAAARAGIGTIALRTGGWPDAALAGAIGIYDDPQDLLDRYELSPFKQPRLVAKKTL